MQNGVKAFRKITMIGAGNVATHMAKAFYDNGIEIAQVYSRSFESAQVLARAVNSSATNRIESIATDADLYIISIKDDSVVSFLEQLGSSERFIAHTAGSIPMDVLSGFASNYGVFYPLQTFSKELEVDFNAVPLCIEANSVENKDKLMSLAQTLSAAVYEVDSMQREQLHLAAVFTCNFVNHMFAISADLLESSDMGFEMLKPLIHQTIDKVMKDKPADVQTGPAVRNDQNIMDKHINMMNDKPQYQKIYRFVSDSIFEFYNDKK